VSTVPQYLARVLVPAQGAREQLVVAADAGAVAGALGVTPEQVLSVEPAKRPRRGARHLDLRLFAQELSTLLRAGIPLLESLTTLQETDSRRGATLDAVTAALREGQSLSQALAAQPQDFDPMFVAVVAAAEGSGQLERALQDHAAFLAWSSALRQRLVAAAIYPALLLVAGGAVVAFLLLYVLPRFAGIFDGLAGEIPAASRWLIAFGVWASAHPLLPLAALALLAGAAVLLARSTAARHVGLMLLWRLPGVHRRWRVLALARLYRSLAVLIGAGVPMPTALRLAGKVLTEPLRPALAAAREAVESGRRISDALHAQGLATPVALRMLRVGEGSGEVAAMLERAASFHDEELARLAEFVARAVNPLLMLLMGVVIGGIVVLMYLPIFTLMEQVQ
jgi:general secretion pathway protein F